ncbi:MAG TPA: hypothetical protein PKU97_10485, partial [Kofleriaceae bacterium]|nr:hypothetical protein [Kofleriaceae bacterium]
GISHALVTHYFGSYVGNTRVVGSIYAKELSGVGELTIEYGRPVTPPSSCDAPPAPSDGDGIE